MQRSKFVLFLLLCFLSFEGLEGCSGARSSNPKLALSATTLNFSGTFGQTISAQSINLMNTGDSPVTISQISVSSPFSTTVTATTCGTLAPSASCAIPISYAASGVGTQTGTLSITSSAGMLAANLTGSTNASTLSASPTSVSFTAAASSQTVTLTNGVPGADVAISSMTLAGSNAASFEIASNTCGSTLSTTCTVTILFQPVVAGAQTATLNIVSNASPSPLSVALSANPKQTFASCGPSICPDLPISGDAVASAPWDFIFQVGVPGFADPSMRKDPNAPVTFLAYSSFAYPSSCTSPSCANNTAVVDLHLAHRADGDSSFQYDGPILTSQPVTQSQTTAYASSNYTSYGSIDLLPIAQSGSTTWVQAHQSYLVAPGGFGYGVSWWSALSSQLTATSYISISAVSVPNSDPATEAAALVKIGSVPEARLGTSFADSTIQLTQILTALSSAAGQCTSFQQPALWYQGTKLFLGLQCLEPVASQDSHQMNYLIYSTTPTGTDATAWTWSYQGEMATSSAASALSTSESLNYTYFTGAEFTKTKAGDLAMLMSTTGTADGVTGQGCRLIPVTSLTSPSLSQDASTGTVAVAGRVDGTGGQIAVAYGTGRYPGAAGGTCTYEPSSNTGIVSARLDADRFSSCCEDVWYALFQSLIAP